MASPFVHFLRRAWRVIRTATGDDAYERYLDHCRTTHGQDFAPLTRREFFAREMDRKWGGVRRCC